MNILCGHLFGDILLQNKYLAKIKRDTVLGCILHCIFVSFGIWVFTLWDFKKLSLVFISHFLIDYFQLGKKYPDLIKQGNPDNFNEPAPMWLKLLSDQTFHLITYFLISLI